MLPTDCEVSDVTCCGDLFDIAEHILTYVHEELLLCYVDIPCPLTELKAYVTMGAGDDGVVDALTVAIQSVAMTPGSVRQGVALPITMQRGIFRVRLRESGWPTAHVENSMIVPPDPAKQNALARHAYAHGEKMYRTLLWMQSRNSLTPSSVPGCRATVGALEPMSPLGGVVGFSVPVTVDLGWGGG